MGVDLAWYAPKPRPAILRVMHKIHCILQGVSEQRKIVSNDEKQLIVSWITENADRYWFSEGGPLCAPANGGADVIIIDDPQMSVLIPLIRKTTPYRYVLYRSHTPIRTDDAARLLWKDFWSYQIQYADLFIGYPIPDYDPWNVPKTKVVYLPATTDWLDGLNKHLRECDAGYYGHIYNQACSAQGMTELHYPARRYIAQVAGFDPAKGIPHVIDAYVEFRRLCYEKGIIEAPQLVICGNGSVEDPDGGMVYDQAMAQMEQNCPHLMKDISVVRLDPIDQVLNTIIANAHVVLQLSTREGFEVRVSEALHAGRPVIVTKAGGMPMQVKANVNSFLVEPGDSKAVAEHLVRLFTDAALHKRMSEEARSGVSDEVGTVGNALSWYYLASRCRKPRRKGTVSRLGLPKLKGGWVNDMARDEAGYPYEEGENRLARDHV